MANKGGVYGGFVLCNFPGGTSWKYRKDDATDSKEEKDANKRKEGESNKSPLAYVKFPIAKFFGIPEIVPLDVLTLARQTRKQTINGVAHQTKALVKKGATGKSRSVAVKFKALQRIGGKQVAMVKVTMPYSYTMGDMINFLMKGDKSNSIAAIVSDKGNSWTFGTPFNPKKPTGKPK